MNIDNKKIIRLFIGGFVFLGLINVIGLTVRSTHQLFFSLFCIVLFALLLKNVWFTLFIWWAALLFCISKFSVGAVYMTNIFYAAILFYMTKLAFEKKHIDFFIKMTLWLVVANLAYSIIQVLGFDFIYVKAEELYFLGLRADRSPNGFMAQSGVAAMLYAFAIPLIATRSQNGIWVALFMLIPIYMLRSSISLAGAIISILFVLYFRVNKKIWLSSLVALMLAGGAYLMYFDTPGAERFPIWKISMEDANKHPIIGWGMDSYKRVTDKKQFTYKLKDKPRDEWDNPHNLLISLVYEFGFLSLILLGGYIRHLVMLFRKSIRSNNLIAMSGFIIAFFVISMANFPIFLARLAVIIIPILALYEVECA